MMFIYLSLILVLLVVAISLLWRLSTQRRSEASWGPDQPRALPPGPAVPPGQWYPLPVERTASSLAVDDDASGHSLVAVDTNLAVLIERNLLELRGGQTRLFSFHAEKARLQNAITLLKLKLELVDTGAKVAVTACEGQIAVQTRVHLLAALGELAQLERDYHRAESELAIATLRQRQQAILERIQQLSAAGGRTETPLGSTTRPDADRTVTPLKGRGERT